MPDWNESGSEWLWCAKCRYLASVARHDCFNVRSTQTALNRWVDEGERFSVPKEERGRL